MSNKNQVDKKRRINFGSVKSIIDYPDFLSIQLKSFQRFFQLDTLPEDRAREGLYRVFKENFPITDTRGNFTLDFIDYSVDLPRYSPEECLERGVTYSAPLKARLRLSCNDEDNEDFDTVEQEVFLGDIPYMTNKGSFIINGVERVVVSQIHKSPGVFFAQTKHTNGTKLYSAKIIPFKGAWMEFATDINNVLYAYIDRKKKFPITILLRAIGYSSDKDILDIFELAEEVETTKKKLNACIGRKLAARVLKIWTEEFVDEETGEVISIDRNEVLLERDSILDEEAIQIILASDTKHIILHKNDTNISDYSIIYNTFNKDDSNSEKEAVEHIYRQLRNAEPPDEQTARETINNLFFSNKRYNLGEVGRYRINKKLKLDVPHDTSVLTKGDIIHIVKHLICLINSKTSIDDIDHLSNRRIRVVGEQLYSQFGVGLARMARTVRERMNVRDSEDFKPMDLINARPLSSVLNAFFGTSPLSQFMDQANPLTEISHKRRISALGPGGLSKDRAGFEVRDIHYTHYGRLCTIETPEGPNIGLISSLCVHAKINDMGFIETPYRTAKNGKIGIKTKKIEYLTAEEENEMYIAQAGIHTDEKTGAFVDKKVKVRYGGDFPVVDPKEIKYVDVAPNQIVSVAASLIPFLEHDDASRALMGSNMQRQAVPLLNPEAPIVGTGLEGRVAGDSRSVLLALRSGTIEYVDSTKIIIKNDLNKEEQITTFDQEQTIYKIPKFKGTNQNTCINLRPIVSVGDTVKKGQILCDGYATNEGELALGRNLRVAFLPWKGYTYEDAIVMSERIVKDDVLTSLHIEEFNLSVRDTKFGEEEFTKEIPNVSEEAIKDLEETGIVRVGAEVNEGDILIGKITPKGETDPTPEEKLLKAIFGEKAHDVRDVSLKATPSLNGVVIGSKLFTRPKRSKIAKAKIKKELEGLFSKCLTNIFDLRNDFFDKLNYILKGKKSIGVFDNLEKEIISKGETFDRKLLEKKIIGSIATKLKSDELTSIISGAGDNIDALALNGWIDDSSANKLVKQLIKNYINKRCQIIGEYKRSKFSLEVGDDLPTGILKLAKVYIAKKRRLKVGDKLAGRHGNKGIVAKIVREEDMPFLEDGSSVDIVLSPLGIPSRMNLGQIYETVLGWAGYKLNKKYATPIFDGASMENIRKELEEAELPNFGRAKLYDGLTGEKFDQKITVGVIYMLKLGHLIDDKMHARSIGPYSLITQQPLGGKSQFGGQRFGEMEVWALEAFGASNVLQEMLTIKSDDIVGRTRAYEAIVKGYNIPESGIPESFNVLINELRGLGIELTLK
ncbi:MAG: DNA-directed RNA polymerase subunit beta [Bacteroidetes bacterium]|nr:DNA-directed RNA polymerase subunit beta [Bacteroidota bacterium]